MGLIKLRVGFQRVALVRVGVRDDPNPKPNPKPKPNPNLRVGVRDDLRPQKYTAAHLLKLRARVRVRA